MQVREKTGGTVTVLTMGPGQARASSGTPTAWGLMRVSF
ncbi:MAG: hypothetical protein V8S58_05165 [Lachnospiraceae bacterium]